jgi:hypothetical protein
LRIIVDEVDGLLVVSWWTKIVVHADAVKFVGGKGLETPDIYIDSEDEVDNCTVDAYFAPSVQEWEQVGELVARETVSESLHYELDIGTFVTASNQVESAVEKAKRHADARSRCSRSKSCSQGDHRC